MFAVPQLKSWCSSIQELYKSPRSQFHIHHTILHSEECNIYCHSFKLTVMADVFQVLYILQADII